MKATLLTIGTAMLFTIVSVTTTAFASPGEKHVEEKGGHHEHGEGNQAGGHEGRMADVMKRLKSELGDKYNQPVPVASKEQLASGKKSILIHVWPVTARSVKETVRRLSL